MSETPNHPPSPAMPVGGFAAISKYNPHLWSPAQLRAIFVARQNELAELLHALRTTPPDTVGQHLLLVGARGMGKSTLMQRLALAVEDDAELNAAWLPLRFPEEQYTVATVGQFWANVFDSLTDALEHQGQPIAKLDAAAQRIAALPAAEQASACLNAINDCADARGQRLLLLVDNSDLLLHNIGRDAHWTLRQTLQSNPRLLWVGGSYQSLEANSGYHDAFLDFFRVITLRPLRLDEMAQALLALAETFGGATARQTMERQLAAHPERLATLRQLSGGNPRTTVMLYELFANGQEGSVRSDLESLLDNMTPLYKTRMDALADLPRKLLAHILEHWAPIALGELAQTSQVAKSSISPQLQRLEMEGLIEKTSLHGTTRSGYQAAERFFNIWYLMRLSPRRQRTRLTWLVEFMRLWFSNDELCGLAHQRMGRHEEAEAAYRQAIALDDEYAYPKANLARLLWRLGRQQEAESLYRDVCALANSRNHELQLQAHLCLGNRQMAMDALEALAQAAQGGDQVAFYRLKEQVWECHELGLGARLADWMAESGQAGFLQPFIQALYTLAGAREKLLDLPAETRQLVEEIVRIGRQRRAP